LQYLKRGGEKTGYNGMTLGEKGCSTNRHMRTTNGREKGGGGGGTPPICFGPGTRA